MPWQHRTDRTRIASKVIFQDKLVFVLLGLTYYGLKNISLVNSDIALPCIWPNCSPTMLTLNKLLLPPTTLFSMLADATF